MLLLLRGHVWILHTSHVGLMLREAHLRVVLGMWLAVMREVSIRWKDWGRLLLSELHLLRVGRGRMPVELCVVGHGCLQCVDCGPICVKTR